MNHVFPRKHSKDFMLPNVIFDFYVVYLIISLVCIGYVALHALVAKLD